MSPLYRGGDILLYLSTLICSSDQFCVCQFCVCQFCVCAFSPSILQAVKHRRWPTVGIVLTHRLRRSVNISPVLGYHVVFDATLNVTDGGPTLTQLWFKASWPWPYCQYAGTFCMYVAYDCMYVAYDRWTWIGFGLVSLVWWVIRWRKNIDFELPYYRAYNITSLLLTFFSILMNQLDNNHVKTLHIEVAYFCFCSVFFIMS